MFEAHRLPSSTATGLRVLVVEDDAMIGMLLAEMLEEMGYSVCGVAVTEDDAVADAAKYMPGLLIVDEHLLEGSGVSAVERILRRGPIPCIFISGAPVGFGRQHANVLQKPFLERDLLRAIERVVGGSAAPKEAPPRAMQG